MKTIIAFDIGGMSVKYALFNREKDQILETGSFKTNQDNGEQVLSQIVDIINELKEKCDIEGIGLSCPGFLKDNTVLAGNIIKGFNGRNLETYFKEKVNLPVAADNDANCAALAEYFAGNGQGSQTLAVVTIGTGIGGGLIIDGKLHSGNHAIGGEFGFMILNGNRFEKFDDNFFSNDASTGNVLKRAYPVLGDDIDGIKLFELYKSGDKQAEEIIEQWTSDLALGLHNIAYCVAPDTILIGGAVSEQDLLIDKTVQKISESTPDFTDDLTEFIRIDKCRFLNDAGIMGAYYNFKNINKSNKE